MLYLLGYKILIQLECFTYYRKNTSEFSSFKAEFPIQVLYLKSFDRALLENCIFISKPWKGILPSIFKNWFKFSFESHSHDTRWSNLGYLKIPSYYTKTYGRYSMLMSSIYVWNHLHSCYQNDIFHQLRANKLKEVLINFFLNR